MDKSKIKEAVASLMQNPNQRVELAEFLTEYVEPQHIVNDWIGMILNYRPMKVGDMLVKKTRKGIKVYSHVLGSEPLRSEITITDRINYILDTAQVSVTANTQELANGEIGTVDSITTEMRAKLRDYFINKVFTALTTIWTAANTPNNFTSVSGSLNSTVLDAAIKYINETTSGAKAIVGSRAALTPITSFAQWVKDPGGSNYALLDPIALEIAKTGWLGSYGGVPIVIAQQSYDYPDTYTKMIPEDKVLVVGHNVGEFITYGDITPQEWTEMKVVPPQWNYTLWTQFGFLIDKAEGIFVLGDIS